MSIRKAPLYASVAAERPADYMDLEVLFNGKKDAISAWTEVDVLGCWASRHAVNEDGSFVVDDDGCYVYEKVYGAFELRYREEPEKPGQDQETVKTKTTDLTVTVNVDVEQVREEMQKLRAANFADLERRIVAYGKEPNRIYDEIPWKKHVGDMLPYAKGGTVTGRWSSIDMNMTEQKPRTTKLVEPAEELGRIMRDATHEGLLFVRAEDGATFHLQEYGGQVQPWMLTTWQQRMHEASRFSFLYGGRQQGKTEAMRKFVAPFVVRNAPKVGGQIDVKTHKCYSGAYEFAGTYKGNYEPDRVHYNMWEVVWFGSSLFLHIATKGNQPPTDSKTWMRCDRVVTKASSLPPLLGDHIGEKMLVIFDDADGEACVGTFRGFQGVQLCDMDDIIVKGNQLYLCRKNGTVEYPPNYDHWRPCTFAAWRGK